MNTIKLNQWAFFIGIIIMQGCEFGKYDDGPLVSLYPDKNRLTKEWNLKKFTINGADSTSLYKCGSCPFFFQFDKSNLLLANYVVNGQQQTVSSGSWSFEDHDKQLNISTTENVLTGPIFNSDAWDITRSTKKQLWISHLKNGRLYEIELE
jgi:hypothetical protein